MNKIPYELRPVRSPGEWQTLHAIRRTVLFPPGRLSVEYDENHPDDRAEGNVPFLLLRDAEPIGVVRLDFRGTVAIVRLVAVAEGQQRQGHGRQLDTLIEIEARRRGASSLRVNAAPDAVGYYEKLGWQHAFWDKGELTVIAEDCIQMTKDL